MPNFQLGKIYSIRSHQTDEVYIGSTIETLSRRLSKHKQDYTGYKNEKRRYITSFKILAYPDYYIELVENYPCADKGELTRREGQIIRETDCVNKVIPDRTKAEWRLDNKDRIKEQYARYYQNNKEITKVKNNCACGGKFTSINRSQHFKTKKHKDHEALAALE